MSAKTNTQTRPSLKMEIEAMQGDLLALMTHIGGIATNLIEANDWAADDQQEEAKLSMEAVSAGVEDAVDSLRKIALKCAEVLS